MHRALSKRFPKLQIVGPYPLFSHFTLGRLFDRVLHRFCARRFNYHFSIDCSKKLSKRISRDLEKADLDLIFAPAASTEIAHLETSIPICYLSDSSFSQMNSYYGNWKGFSKRAKNEADQIESLALKKADSVVYPSKWAADYTERNYALPNSKIYQIPFGANIDDAPRAEDVFPKRLSQPIRLLFLGVTWQRKGGDIAFEAFKLLRDQGFDIRLTVCGCVPPVTHPDMEVIPFLNKGIPADYTKFKGLLKASHLLILPTRAEAYGVVFCEASSYGIPSITTATGGTPAVVADEQNGFALPYESTATDYARTIKSIINSSEGYESLCISSRKRYDEVLNWDSWAQSISEVFVHTIASSRSSSKPGN